MDEYSRADIDKAVERLLREAGIHEPPVRIADVLAHLELYRDFYNLTDPSLLRRFWHKVQINGRRLVRVARRIKLAAVWLPDESRILVDASLPEPKKEWASFHDTTHSILEWHRPFFLGDTAQMLDPEFQEELEMEANYGASALMFGGRMFTRDALDVARDWGGLTALRKRYGSKSYVTTLRRFVEFGHDHPMVAVVSTPWWAEVPADQTGRCRHFVPSPRFQACFSGVSSDHLVDLIDENTIERRGGPVGEFGCALTDDNGADHEFRVESFYNRHYVLSLCVQHRRAKKVRIVIPNIIKFPVHLVGK